MTTQRSLQRMARITVIMPVYNAMPFLPEAIESFFRQTPAGAKLRIVDDGSTDGSGEYLRGLHAENLAITRRSCNAGPGRARNEALEACESEFVAFMDADDVAQSGRLAAQLEFLESHPDVGLVGTQFTYLGSGGRTGFGGRLPLEHHQIFANLKQGRHAIHNATVMARTSLVKSCGGYATSRCGEDWDLFLRIGERARLANLDGVFNFYRLHPGSVRAKRLQEERERISYAIDCAERREGQKPEISFERFRNQQKQRPLWQRATDSMLVYALGEYRRAVTDILHGSQVKGHARLAWAALNAPTWTLRRLARTVTTPSLSTRMKNSAEAAK